jgi:hypothetical protein
MLVFRAKAILENHGCHSKAVEPEGDVVTFVLGQPTVSAAWTNDNGGAGSLV